MCANIKLTCVSFAKSCKVVFPNRTSNLILSEDFYRLCLYRTWNQHPTSCILRCPQYVSSNHSIHRFSKKFLEFELEFSRFDLLSNKFSHIQFQIIHPVIHSTYVLKNTNLPRLFYSLLKYILCIKV